MLQVTCAIIVKNKKILITQNGEGSDHPFLWEFPGGKINLNETREACIKREILEELGVEINILKQLFSVIFDYGFKKITLIPFLCSIRKHEIRISEHYDFRWIDLDELKEFEFSEADEKLIRLNENLKLLKEYLGE